MLEIIISSFKLIIEGLKAFFTLKAESKKVRTDELARGMAALYFALGRIVVNGRLILAIFHEVRERQDNPRLFERLHHVLMIQEHELTRLNAIDFMRMARNSPIAASYGVDLPSRIADLPVYDYESIGNVFGLLDPKLQERIWYMLRAKAGFLQSLIRVSGKGKPRLIVDTVYSVEQVDELDLLLADSRVRRAINDTISSPFEADVSEEAIP